MHIKYREAAINLSKQNKIQVKPDPLSSICHEKIQALRKAQLKAELLALERTSLISITQKSRQSESRFKGSKFDQQKHRLIKKERKKKHRYINGVKNLNSQSIQCWEKYLPKDEDEFEEVEYQRTKLRQKLDKQQIFLLEQIKAGQNITKQNCINEEQKKKIEGQMQNQDQSEKIKQKPEKKTILEVIQQKKQKNPNQASFDMATINIQSLKKELGILIQKEESRPKIQQVPKPQVILNDFNNSKACKKLPFAGRPFEQAPPKPEPKMIHEYAPTCKVAGLYAWPPPRTQHRMWRKQMRESRKLK